MAMPRLAGGTWLTRSPSIRRRRTVASSSPAMMRRSVDLPQPDGPTKTTNSPSCDLEVDVLQHLGRAEGLADVFELEDHAVIPRGSSEIDRLAGADAFVGGKADARATAPRRACGGSRSMSSAMALQHEGLLARRRVPDGRARRPSTGSRQARNMPSGPLGAVDLDARRLGVGVDVVGLRAFVGMTIETAPFGRHDVFHEEGGLGHHRPPARLVPADRAVVEDHLEMAVIVHVGRRSRRTAAGPCRAPATGAGVGDLAHDVDIVHAAVDDRRGGLHQLLVGLPGRAGGLLVEVQAEDIRAARARAPPRSAAARTGGGGGYSRRRACARSRWPSATTRSASATVVASGFSTKTCAPASIAAQAIVGMAVGIGGDGRRDRA